MIDLDRLPKMTKDVVEYYLGPLLPRMDKDYLVLLIQYGISKILCANRVTLTSEEINCNKVFPAIYTLFFDTSGAGKGYSMKELNVLMRDFYEDFEIRSSEWRKVRMAEVNKAAQEDENLLGSSQAAFIRENEPRNLRMNMGSDTTPEGYMATREVLQQAKIGVSCLEASEIFDDMRAGVKARNSFDELITQVKESYDYGNNNGKIIKGNKRPIDIKNVPNVIALHGSIDTDESDREDMFKNFFDGGMARRSFVCMSKGVEVFEKISLEKSKELMARAREARPALQEMFSRINKATNNGLASFSITGDVENLYYEYKEDMAEKAFKIKGGKTMEGVRLEILGRPWTMLRQAMISCVQECATNNEWKFVLTKAHVEQAIYMVGYYGDNHFKPFYLRESEPIGKKMMDYLVENGPKTKSEIIGSRLLKGRDKAFAFSTLFEKGLFQDYLDGVGKTLMVGKGGYRGIQTVYSVEDVPEHKLQAQLSVSYSQAVTNSEYETTFAPSQIDFTKFHEITCADKRYAPTRFKDNYRKGDNWLAGDDLIILDVDNEVDEDKQLTIEMAQERLREFMHLIVPTRNHLKEKKEHGIRERFRIILPTTPMENITREKYGEIMVSLIKTFNLNYKVEVKNKDGKLITKSWVDLPAAKDPAKMYIGFNSTPYYNQGLLFNWKCLLVNRETETKVGNNTFNSNIRLSIKGKNMGFTEYTMEAIRAGGKTIPCKAHCHEDKNASAFISINRNGQFQYTCSACGISEFYKI